MKKKKKIQNLLSINKYYYLQKFNIRCLASCRPLTSPLASIWKAATPICLSEDSVSTPKNFTTSCTGFASVRSCLQISRTRGTPLSFTSDKISNKACFDLSNSAVSLLSMA